MTKEEKIARYSKLNQEVVPGKIAMAGACGKTSCKIYRYQ